ncbi:major facilitator superfamily domain-containing protein [Cercophora samala]|uniref:Major facilitator superfamily domain-containing protein n=1 Tax=Cercophora samala TaxID=330535 RepID=A0AA39ZF16_9PEZI|nr:major facilitator superfamily domain-containing protein [Cercophora samala]
MSLSKTSSVTPSAHHADQENHVTTAAWTPQRTTRLVQKLDLHIIPYMSLIYLLSFLDRANIGNARLDNLESDLGLRGLQYNDCLAILFPFYIASEIPSNLMLKKVRPSRWLCFIMVCWSIVMISQGFVKSYAGLMATRALLGVFEGGLFPGAAFYITTWYCRDEVGLRLAMFFSAATLAGAFGGMLARGIAEMKGVGGLPAWAWIFILEGLLTLVVSAVAPWMIHDCPETARFLTEEEKVEVKRRIAADHGRFSQEFDMKYVWQALKDWKIYVHTGINLSTVTPLYSISLFLPTIIRNMGYTANSAQLMSVPPYVIACVFTLLASWVGDRYKQRAALIIPFQLIALAGFAMLITTDAPGVQYTGTVFAAIGIFSQLPLSLAWNAGNIRGSLKRATGIAMQVMGGNCGGVIAAYVYQAADMPRFLKGHGILIGFISLSIVLTLGMTIWCRRENARQDSIQAPTPTGLQDSRLETDRVLWFRYQV